MMQSNKINKGGEAASTFEHFPSGCGGQVNGGLLRVLLLFYSHSVHARDGGELYVAIAISRRCGGGNIPKLPTQFSGRSSHRWRLFFGDVFLYTFREGRKEGTASAVVAAAAVSVCDSQH